jgi:hypothetical protein
MQNFLDGCGVCYAHWIPILECTTTKCKFDTPQLAVAHKLKTCTDTNGSLTRVLKALYRYSVNSWEDLLKVEYFGDWRSFGLKSHNALKLIAEENDYVINPYFR